MVKSSIYMYILGIMILDTDNMKLKFFAGGHSVIDEKWNKQNVFETSSKLYCFIAGDVKIVYEDKSVKMIPGCAYLIPPRVYQSWYSYGKSEILWIHFNMMLYETIDILEYHSFKRFFNPGQERFFEKVRKCIEFLCYNDMYSQLQCKRYFFDVFSNFFRFQPPRRNANEEKMTRIEPVVRYIEKNISDKLSLNELAKLAAYEKTYFSALFKDIYGVSPKHFVLMKKIEKAKHLLISTTFSLEEISGKVGFHDVFHFSKTFKNFTGEAPSFFRKRHLNKFQI